MTLKKSREGLADLQMRRNLGIARLCSNSQKSTMPPAFTPAPAGAHDDLAAIRSLFKAYAGSLPVDLSYQGFADELAGLPGKYVPPHGELLLARDASGTAIGCAALRPLEPPLVCEMKRLFVSPQGRGTGCGRALAEEVLATARLLGYREIRLDTLPTMAGAQNLYANLGFTPVAPYYETPVAGTVFLGKML